MEKLLSACYFDKYVQSVRTNDNGQVEIKLEFLDLAIRADANNANAQQEIARLMLQGSETPEMKASLLASIANGTASAVTHLIIANYHMTNGNRDKAINNFRIALEKQPNHPIALNNLAFLLVEDESKQEEALEMIETAISAAVRPNPSLLDTKGAVQMKMGKFTAAISSFQEAIRWDPLKLVSLENLANCYDELEMDEMAATQRTRIEEVKQVLADRKKELEKAAAAKKEQATDSTENEGNPPAESGSATESDQGSSDTTNAAEEQETEPNASDENNEVSTNGED
ncbi:MAG: tetratricopeptide repeat protein, partial [Planctomycetota bacterium]